ncbi:MAG TPA: DUF1800 domain-containing protein [Pyrinomonadaceae bacterium]|nr:DUF1800 domain-containing protein [Pyrinomonadaceae bacterium]
MIHIRNNPSRSAVNSRFVITFVIIAAILFSVLPSAAQKEKRLPAGLKEDQRILHVLNRLGFGARPGDVARVKAMGLENYINQQLSPAGINDAVAEAKVKDLSTLNMTTAQLYEKFPQPGLLLKQLERRGELPESLATARDNRVKGGNAAPVQLSTQPPAQPPPGDSMEMAADGSPKKDSNNAAKPNENGDPRDNQKYRQALREYYAQNGLQLPQRISAELQASRILRAVYSERQLQEVMVDFWSNHFNVFAGKGADRWLLVSYDRDTIRPNALGKFSDLLAATAQSPAMLFYLDNFQSVSPDAQLGPGGGGGLRRQQRGGMLDLLMGGRQNRQNRQLRNEERYPNATTQQPAGVNNPQQPQRQRRGINENYARELMELHTLGVEGGYTQKDVQEVARCFTGWTIFAPRGGGAATQAMLNGPRADMLRKNSGKFFFNARAHDDGEKLVLGHKIPAGGGMKDGLMVLDILAHHPATAKFVATKLVRHFVSDTPPPALVDRVATAFTKSNGDIRETLRAIFFSPEFNSESAYRAKIKRPFELTISAIRTLGGETTGGPQLHQWIARMGEPLYGFQTPNGYSDSAESWVNTGALLERLNFGLTLASNRIPGTRVNLKQFLSAGDGGPALDKAQIMDRFLSLIVAGEITPRTREALLKQLNEQAPLVVPAMTAQMPATDNSMGNEMTEAQRPFRQRQGQQLARADASITDPVTKIVGLILGSPEFQRQ